MRNNYKVAVGVLTIMILLTLTVGTSYSYYTVSGNQESIKKFQTTCFNVSFGDTEGTDINLNNSYPMDDTAGQSRTPYHFAVSNTCDTSNAEEGYKIYYYVTLNTDTTTSTLNDYLKYRVDKNSTAITNTSEPPMLSSAPVFTKHSTLLPTGKTPVGGTSYTIASGELGLGITDEFDLRLWIAENACTDSDTVDCSTTFAGKTFNGVINVYYSSEVLN